MRRTKDYFEFYLSTVAEYARTLGGWMRELGIDTPIIHNSAGPGMNALFRETVDAMGDGFLLGSDHYYNLSQDARQNNPTPQHAINVFASNEMLRLYGYPPTVFELPAGSLSDWPPITASDAKAFYFANVALGMKGHNYYIFTGGPNPPGDGRDRRRLRLRRAHRRGRRGALALFHAQELRPLPPRAPLARRRRQRVRLPVRARLGHGARGRSTGRGAPACLSSRPTRGGFSSRGRSRQRSARACRRRSWTSTATTGSPTRRRPWWSLLVRRCRARGRSAWCGFSRAAEARFSRPCCRRSTRTSALHGPEDFLGAPRFRARGLGPYPAHRRRRRPISTTTAGLFLARALPAGAEVVGTRRALRGACRMGDGRARRRPRDSAGFPVASRDARARADALLASRRGSAFAARSPAPTPTSGRRFAPTADRSMLFAMNLLSSQMETAIECRPSWAKGPVDVGAMTLGAMTVKTMELGEYRSLSGRRRSPIAAPASNRRKNLSLIRTMSLTCATLDKRRSRGSTATLGLFGFGSCARRGASR